MMVPGNAKLPDSADLLRRRLNPQSVKTPCGLVHNLRDPDSCKLLTRLVEGLPRIKGINGRL